LSLPPNKSASSLEALVHGRLKAITTDDSHWIHGDDTTNISSDGRTLPQCLDPDRVYALRARGVTSRQSRGAGIGLVLYDPVSGTDLWSSRLFLSGSRAGLEAEYSAICLGMDFCHDILSVRRLLVESSYHAVVHQLTGVYTTRKPSLQVLLQHARNLQQQFDDCAFCYITSLSDMFKVETLAFRALATLRSSGTLMDWEPSERDPMNQVSWTIPHWKQPTNPRTALLPDSSPARSIDIDPAKTYLLRFDGGARSDFGVAGVGMVLYEDDSTGQEIWSGWYFHDDNVTNNVAEYLGMLFGLKVAKSLRIRRLVVQGDSLLVVRQMNEDCCRTKDDSLSLLRDEARNVAKGFSKCEIGHIPRSQNSRADWLACHAMDKGNTYGFHFL
jgi:ribonuclease HI